MKILLVSNMYPSPKHPHYGVFVENTEKELCRRNFVVKKCVLVKETMKIKKILSYMWFYVKIFVKALFCRYDFVYVHYVSHCALPLLAAKKIRKKIRIISNVHGNDIIPETTSDIKYLYRAVRLLEKSEKIVVPSSYFSNEIHRRYDVDKNKMVVFPSGGVNRKIFSKKNKQEAKKNAGLEEKFRYIGYVSRIEEKKGWDTFVEMIALWKERIPSDIRFLIVGEGTQENDLHKKIDELQLNDYIKITKMKRQSELSDIYNSLDIFCFPTYRQSESLGLVGIEALACGCVVLSTDEYGPSTYIQDGINGFVFKSRDAVNMLEKIENILQLNNDEKIVIENNAEKKSDEFNSEKIIVSLCDMLEKI